jgi:hypothetical protein
VSLARAAILVGALLLAGCASGSEGGSPTTVRHGAHREGAAAPARAARPAIPDGRGHLAAMARSGGLILRNRPGGRVIAHLRPHTAYGSPTVVWAARRRGRWLAVPAASLPNNRLGWLDVDRDRPRMWRSRYEIAADLSERTALLRRGARVLRRIPISIGRPDTPTPTGRFSVTDKLFTRGGGYGCCILALSGHQPHLRPGWAGGDRIAIHGSPTQGVGEAASAGCLRARDEDLKYLLKRVPLGTPVEISP